MARLGRRLRVRPEPAGVAVVLLHERYALRIKRWNHPSVDAEEPRRIVLDHHVGYTPAGLAAMKGQSPAIPDVGIGRVGATDKGDISPLGVHPQSAVSAADGAVAIQHPLGLSGKLEANGCAMTGCFDHR